MTKKLQFSWRGVSYNFTLKAGYFLFCLSLVILCCLLARWQWHRYHQKQEMFATFKARSHATPLLWANIHQPLTELEYQSVKVQGKFINSGTVLLPNRYYQDQLGVEVLTPLQMAKSSRLLLIDRGWLYAPHYPELPIVAPVNGVQTITGYIKRVDERHFILGKNIMDPHAVPLVMQYIDLDALAEVTHFKFYPVILRMSPSSPHGFTREWQLSTVPPERHLAYTVQWLLLALVGIILFLITSCERIEK